MNRKMKKFDFYYSKKQWQWNLRVHERCIVNDKCTCNFRDNFVLGKKYTNCVPHGAINKCEFDDMIMVHENVSLEDVESFPIKCWG